MGGHDFRPRHCAEPRGIAALRRILGVCIFVGAAACSSRTDPGGGPSTPPPPDNRPADPTNDTSPPIMSKKGLDAEKGASLEANTAWAYFAGGCFWGVEYYMEQIDGVLDVDSGYMGGRIENPNYEQVSEGNTGHLEAVRIQYDRSRVDYETLARRFFEIHDPTQANGQGPDIGSQYLSAVFVASESERRTTETLIELLEKRGYAVVTEIKPVTDFYRAEDYHQDYYANTRKKPYCHTRIRRFGADGE